LHTQEPTEQMLLLPQVVPSVTFPNEQRPVTVLQLFALHAVVDAGQPAVTQLWTHTPLVPGLEQTKPGAQSPAEAQVVLQAVPPTGQAKAGLGQACGEGKLQEPALHVAASAMLGNMHVGLLQVTVGNEQALLTHFPSQAANVFDARWQSASTQQLLVVLGMQVLVVVHDLKPELVGQLQIPAPVQTKLAPHDVETLPPQVPAEQVPVLSV